MFDQRNPLRPIAIVGIISIAIDTMTIVSVAGVDYSDVRAIFRIGFFALFLALYARRSAYAWHSLWLTVLFCVEYIVRSALDSTPKGVERMPVRIAIALVVLAGLVWFVIGWRSPYFRFLAEDGAHGEERADNGDP